MAAIHPFERWQREVLNDFSLHPEISTGLHVPDLLKLQRIRIGCRVHLQKLEATEDGGERRMFRFCQY